jgi:ParB-like nuclease domain
MKLLTTTNYSMFQVASTNRNVGKTAKLEASMRKHGFIGAYPLHVVKNAAGKLEIKAGHHRFAVAEKLKIPMHYVVCSDEMTIADGENTTSRWSISDYLTMFERTGNLNYIEVKDYHERTGIAIGMCISMLGGELASSSNKLDAFKRGTYKISSNQDHSDDVEILVNALKLSGIKWATDCKVIQSLSRIVAGGHADIEQFKKRIAANASFIVKKQNMEQYADMWQEIYNRHTKGPKLQLTFLTNEAVKQSQLFPQLKKKA